jgi:hypothetical protein
MSEQKSDGIVVETEAPVEQICRATLASLISALQELKADTACSWNVVDATEVLMDAGQYLLARKLSARVADLLESDGRGPLWLRQRSQRNENTLFITITVFFFCLY